MRRFLFTLSLLLACAAAGAAQSGRVKRAEPAPTPPREHPPAERGADDEAYILKRGEPGQPPERDAEGNEVYDRREVLRKAQILSKPLPRYTRSARRHRVRGVVRLRMVLAASGKVERITVLQGLPEGLTEEAVKVAQQIKFVPAERDGRKVSQYVIVEYNFNVW